MLAYLGIIHKCQNTCTTQRVPILDYSGLILRLRSFVLVFLYRMAEQNPHLFEMSVQHDQRFVHAPPRD